ncbi:MAG: PulJ/GspJ family protein [Bdellovibrionota bacterium]
MKRHERGFSLIEVIVAVGSVAIVTYSFMSVMDLRSSSLLKVHYSYVLSDIVVSNINEVKSKNFSLLPTPGNCLVRHYNLDAAENAVFASETTVASDAAACGKDPATQKVIDIFWKTRSTADVQASVSFAPSDFLKLPTIRSSIVEIEVRGRMLSSGASPSEQTFGTIIYRK